MFAIIETGGKQLLVSKDQEIYIEKIDGIENDIIKFDRVLVINDHVGAPILEKAQVIGQILKQGKQKKIIVFKYKPKKNSKTKYGHRQPYTKVKITDIFLDGEKEMKKETSKKPIKKIVKEKAKEAVKEWVDDGKSSSTKKKPATKSTAKPKTKEKK